jgi:uncharacterized membrane protein HdeD (DUF308 family)
VATDPDLAVRNERRDRWLDSLAGTASLIAMMAIVGLFVNWIDAYVSLLGAPVVVTEEEVRSYWLTLAVFVGAFLTSFGVAVWRRTGASPWHLILGVAGVAAAVLFAVTTPGTPHDDRVPPPSHHTGPVCHSGGDSSDCPGG